MTTDLEQIWSEILDRVCEIAPATFAALHPAAADISAAEARLGVTFGSELSTWFQVTRGSTMIPLAQLLPLDNVISLDDAVLLTESSRLIWSDTESGNETDDLTVAGTTAGTWMHEYVHIGLDGMGGGLFVDLRRGPLHGCVRWWDKVETDVFDPEPLATSVTHLLAQVRDALTYGTPVQDWTPAVTDRGLLTWSFDDSSSTLPTA